MKLREALASLHRQDARELIYGALLRVWIISRFEAVERAAAPSGSVSQQESPGDPQPLPEQPQPEAAAGERVPVTLLANAQQRAEELRAELTAADARLNQAQEIWRDNERKRAESRDQEWRKAVHAEVEERDAARAECEQLRLRLTLQRRRAEIVEARVRELEDERDAAKRDALSMEDRILGLMRRADAAEARVRELEADLARLEDLLIGADADMRHRDKGRQIVDVVSAVLAELDEWQQRALLAETQIVNCRGTGAAPEPVCEECGGSGGDPVYGVPCNTCGKLPPGAAPEPTVTKPWRRSR